MTLEYNTFMILGWSYALLTGVFTAYVAEKRLKPDSRLRGDWGYRIVAIGFGFFLWPLALYELIKSMLVANKAKVD